jgi:hypothetical protein
MGRNSPWPLIADGRLAASNRPLPWSCDAGVVTVLHGSAWTGARIAGAAYAQVRGWSSCTELAGDKKSERSPPGDLGKSAGGEACGPPAQLALLSYVLRLSRPGVPDPDGFSGSVTRARPAI